MVVVQTVFFQFDCINKKNIAFFLPNIQHLCLHEITVDSLDSLTLLSLPLKSLWIMHCVTTFDDAIQLMQSFAELREVSIE